MYIQTEQSPEGSKFPSVDHLNHDLYYEIIKERKRLGMENANDNIVIEDHPLVGKKIVDTTTEKEYNVEQVNKQWYGGWYIGLLIECNGSHGFIWYENVDCWNDSVTDSIKKNKIIYTVLED